MAHEARIYSPPTMKMLHDALHCADLHKLNASHCLLSTELSQDLLYGHYSRPLSTMYTQRNLYGMITQCERLELTSLQMDNSFTKKMLQILCCSLQHAAHSTAKDIES